MAHPKIQLLIFNGCPLADAARSSLQTALQSMGLHEFEEIDLLDPAAPDELKGWGSPTILVGGEDVTGNVRGNALGCRVYDDEAGVPSPEMIARRISSIASSDGIPDD